MPKININIQDLTSKQEEILNSIISTDPKDGKIHIVRGSRQAGKSHLLIRAILYFIAQPKAYGGVISASWDQYQELFSKFLEVCPESIIASVERGKDLITFVNGSRLHFYTGKNPDKTRGPSYDFLILDEAAIYPQGAIDIILATVAARPNAKVVIASTPKGRNDFWRYCSLAKPNGYIREYFMSYLDNPYYDRVLVEEMRKTLSPFVFNQEYLGQFVFGKGSVFGEFSTLQKISEWIRPIDSERYFFGIDVAASGDDFTVLTIMNTKGQVVYVYEAKNERIPNQAIELKQIIERYDAEGYCECNGLGIGLAETLQDLGVKCHKFWMSNESKQEMVSNTLRDIAEGAISLPSVEICPKLDNEMSTYEVSRTTGGKLTYSHPKGLHDDHVDSLNIANWAKYKLYYGGTSQIYDPKEELKDLNPTPTTLDIKVYNDIENLYD